jgi:hypothetical protein
MPPGPFLFVGPIMIETIQTADSVPVARTPLPVLRIHEDWLAVILGVTVLALALLGAVPALPALKWPCPEQVRREQ